MPGSPATPRQIVAHDGRLRRGLGAGALPGDPLAEGPRKGRARRWSYAAAADDRLAIGAAIVDLGVVAAAFVWCWAGGELHQWERRSAFGRRSSVGPDPSAPATFSAGGDVRIERDGALTLEVPTAAGRVVATLRVTAAVTPVSLVTATPAGGWNATEKAAGYTIAGSVTVDGSEHALDGVGWRDWTAGRQDRRTTWRWAAGAGTARVGGARVGLNVSTGMNAVDAGEDVVWWDGRPHPLAVEVLQPVGRPDGPWRVAGPDWGLDLSPTVVRAADERLPLMSSRYVQPVGRFVGTLPGPSGEPVEVDLLGVTEDHEARW